MDSLRSQGFPAEFLALSMASAVEFSITLLAKELLKFAATSPLRSPPLSMTEKPDDKKNLKSSG